jgi:RNA polymerase sigma factor (sigma-70 family)
MSPPVDDGGELARIVRRAQRGDAVALDRLVRELTPSLGRICGAIALSDGDDALQETMMAIVRNLGSLREPAAVRGWARTIAVHEAARVARRRDVPLDPDEIARDRLVRDEADGSVEIPDDATALQIRDVLSRLAPEQRAVLVLRHLDDLSEQDTAAALGVAVGTVKSRLNRAKRAFRARWHE